MKVINLPEAPKGAQVEAIPTFVSKWAGIPMRGFTVQGIDFSLEEAHSIEGFIGYVVVEKQEFTLKPSPLNYDKHKLPLPIVGVCFVR